jgi:hypothetical protein
MYPLNWQDQFNLHKKGMTLMDMCLLLLSLEAIERFCTQEKSNSQSIKKASNKSRKGNNRSGTESTAKVPKKVCSKKHCILCKKHGGAHTTHNTKDCHKYEKDGSEKANIHANPMKQSFTQLSKKLDKLEKAIKKLSAKSKKHCRDDSNSNSGLGFGSGSIGKVEIKFGETLNKTKFTPPILIKKNATPTIIDSIQDDVRLTSFSNADNVMLMS